MVGYSRLIELDDADTLQRLGALRRNLIDPTIEEHGGRIVQTGGDSLLVVFDSVDGAVRCAVKVQEQVPIHDSDHPPDRAIRFRVGINLGDAIHDGSDLHGDAVNIAARLQAEAPAGGICMSRSVRDHVHGRLGLEFIELGALELKNIARPVEAFLVRSCAAAIPKSVERSLVYGTGETLPLPGKPSIAVLAFDNMSSDPEQVYFSDGVSEDIIAELSRSRSLFVIARNSSFTYKGRAVDVRNVARDLGVRYLLEGSVRRSRGRARIVAQLIEAQTGDHIWAERYDRAVEDVFAVQDEIARAVVTAIVPAVTEAELRRIFRKPPGSLDAWEAYQRGLWHFGKVDATNNSQAREYLLRAIELDASFASPHAILGLVYENEGIIFGTRSLDDATKLAASSARKAMEIDPTDPDANATVAYTEMATGICEKSWENITAALTINPNSSWAHAVKGALLVYSGQHAEARDAVLTALRLSPRDPLSAVPQVIFFLSHYFERDYSSSLESVRRAISRFPNLPIAHRYLAASLGQLNRFDEANEALERCITVGREVFALNVRSCPPWMRPVDHENFMAGLRKAGWTG
jgi:adenylate cyclase